MLDLAEHRAVAELYQAETISSFAKGLIDLIGSRIAHEMLFIALLPIKFELPCVVSVEKYKTICNQYLRESNKRDIWLRRSPIGPSVTAVRHSDYTPVYLLKRSTFYRDVVKPMNGENGASIVAWHENTWLATLTVLKRPDQGDFSEDEMNKLRAWQVHFQANARRLAAAKENRLDDESFSTSIWDLPASLLILDWDMSPRQFTAEAVELCNVWQYGVSVLNKKISHRRLRVPKEILVEIPKLKPQIESAKLARPGSLRRVELRTLPHPSIHGLSAKFYFVPSKSLSLSRGRFLIQFHFHRLHSASDGASIDLSSLSRQERKVALQAARGLTNPQIGRFLHKSPRTVKFQLSEVFKKLNLKSRVELASLLSPTSLSGARSIAAGDESMEVLN
jgi:DNA-binding CsgD family transcriptional regulator